MCVEEGVVSGVYRPMVKIRPAREAEASHRWASRIQLSPFGRASLDHKAARDWHTRASRC